MNAGTKTLHHGEVVEWFKALVLKTSEVRASVGSNPTLSAIWINLPRSVTGAFLLLSVLL